jgi:hypothetical protein
VDGCHPHVLDDGCSLGQAFLPQLGRHAWSLTRAAPPRAPGLHGAARATGTCDVHLPRLPHLRLFLGSNLGPVRPRQLIQQHDSLGSLRLLHGFWSVHSHVVRRW